MTKHNKWKVLKVQDHIKLARQPQVEAQPTQIRGINYSYEERFTLWDNIHHISLYSRPAIEMYQWQIFCHHLKPISDIIHFSESVFLWWYFGSVMKKRSSSPCFILWWDFPEASRTLHIWNCICLDDLALWTGLFFYFFLGAQ